MKRLLLFSAVVWGMQVCAAPYITDLLGNPLSPPSRTLCGQENRVLVRNAPENIKRMASPIGRYESFSDDRKKRVYCSSTLISPGSLLLTNSHCKVSCQNMRVRFDYWEQGGGDVYNCESIVESGDGGDEDYMIVQLEGHPAQKYGYYPLLDEPLEENQQLVLIGHPRGDVAHASWDADCSFKGRSGGVMRHRCDTSPGNSGSGILLPGRDGSGNFVAEGTRVVGVHAFGSCNSSSSSANSGPAINYLSGLSQLVEWLAATGFHF